MLQVPVAGLKVGASIWLNSPFFFSFCCLPSITINLVMNLKDFWILILGGFFKKRNHFHSEHMDVQIISHNHNLLICKRAIKILISKAPF